MKDIFTAAREGDIDSLTEHLKQTPDLSAKNSYGFTVLHCLAMGANSLPEETVLKALSVLLLAGSPLELKSNDGRTPLFMMAEFTKYVEPVQAMLDAGAEADVYDTHGNHIIENAMMDNVKELLSRVTGRPVPKPRVIRKSVSLKADSWKRAKADLDIVFNLLSTAGLIALQDAGTTQSDGFDDCAQVYQGRSDKDLISGFCFYTRQDLSRARRTAELSLALWGAPDGSNESIARVGKIVVDIFVNNGFDIEWSGKSTERPAVYLHNYVTKTS